MLNWCVQMLAGNVGCLRTSTLTRIRFFSFSCQVVTTLFLNVQNLIFLNVKKKILVYANVPFDHFCKHYETETF